MANKESLPYISYVKKYIFTTILLLFILFGIIFYRKFMFFKAKVTVPDSKFELALDFNKIGKLQTAYFAFKEPERFEPQDEFKIYDTVLMQSISDKLYDTIVSGNVLKKPEVEVISGEKLKLQNKKAELANLKERLKKLKTK